MAEKKSMPLLPGSTEPEIVGTIGELLNRFKDRIVKSLPRYIDPERFTRIVLTTLRQNEFLQKCSVESIVGAVMEAAADGLELDGVEAAMVPYWNKELGTFEAQYQEMYQGLLKEMRRSGEIVAIHAHEVYEGDLFKVTYGSHPEIVHEAKWEKTTDDAITHWYAVFDLKTGGQQFDVMTRDEMLRHRERSKSFQREKNSPWKTDLKMMGRKTILRRGMKLCPTDDHAREVLARSEQRDVVFEVVPIDTAPPADKKQPPALEAAKTLFGEVTRWFRHTGADDPKSDATKLLRAAVPKESMVDWNDQDVVQAREQFVAYTRKPPTAAKPREAEAPPPDPPAEAPPKDQEPPPPQPADAFVEPPPTPAVPPTDPPKEPKEKKPAKLAEKRDLSGAAKAMRRWCAEVDVEDPSTQEDYIERYWRELGAEDGQHVTEELFGKVRRAGDTEEVFKVLVRGWADDARKAAAGGTEGGEAVAK